MIVLAIRVEVRRAGKFFSVRGRVDMALVLSMFVIIIGGLNDILKLGADPSFI